MNVKDLRIIFMGTPEFAVASLDALVAAGWNVVGIITAPDKQGGRGMNLQQSAVKKYALEKGLKILQPQKLKDPQFIDELQSLKADLQVVVAFRMLPEVVWNHPLMGTINVHASLLPQYRGAAPINWAVINGEKESGVTTFKLKHEIDTGDILLQQKVAIADDETAGTLHDQLMYTGAGLLVKTITGLADGSLKETPQSECNRGPSETLKHAPKLFTATCSIDWNKPVDDVYNLVRGLSPYPAAFTLLKGKTLKIFSCEKEIIKPDIPPGEFSTDKKTFLKFACVDGFIWVKELQIEGKKRIGITDFLRGYRF